MSGESVKGELCNGIAYIDWKLLRNPPMTLEDSSVMRCIGRHHKFELSSHQFSDFPSSDDEAVKERFVRSIGSTAVMFSDPDRRGKRTGRAQAVGPWPSSAAEVGPLEEKLVELADRVSRDGYEETFLDPLRLLSARTVAVAKRSFIMLSSSLFPISDFTTKMKSRVPEVARESYDIATSIRIEIKIEDSSEKEQ